MIAKGHVRFVLSVSFSAAGSADNSQPENLFLAFEQFIAQKLSLCLFKADALDRVGKTFAGNALITEKKNGFFNKLTGADKFRPRILYYSYRTIFVPYCPRSSAARG